MPMNDSRDDWCSSCDEIIIPDPGPMPNADTAMNNLFTQEQKARFLSWFQKHEGYEKEQMRAVQEEINSRYEADREWQYRATLNRKQRRQAASRKWKG